MDDRSTHASLSAKDKTIRALGRQLANLGLIEPDDDLSIKFWATVVEHWPRIGEDTP